MYQELQTTRRAISPLATNSISESGFTLIELLTAIGVFGILAAILFPVFARTRENSRRTTCTSNLRQIGAALTMYTSDSDGAFPPDSTAVRPNKTGVSESAGQDWGQLISPYLNSTNGAFPSCPDRELPGDFSYWQAAPTFSGYAYNSSLSQIQIRTTYTSKKTGKRLGFSEAGTLESSVSFPALVVEVEETRTGILGARLPDDSQQNLLATATVYGYDSLILRQTFGAFRHAGGSNYLFVDGHVRWYVPSAISTKPTCDGLHPGMSL